VQQRCLGDDVLEAGVTRLLTADTESTFPWLAVQPTLTRGTTARAKSFVVPRQLGPVRLIREIGRGGMGVVWLARHEILHRDVAVKFVLSLTTPPNGADLRRFLDEARLTAAASHPALVSIHHADIVGGLPYLVMEYVPGLSLHDVLRKVNSLTLSPALF